MQCVASQRNTALANAHSIEDVERILSDAEEPEEPEELLTALGESRSGTVT